MDIDKEPLITEKEEESTMGFKPYIKHRRRRMSMLSSVILLLATVALILTLTRLLAGNRLRLSSIQLILFESDNGKSQLIKVDFVADGKCTCLYLIKHCKNKCLFPEIKIP